MLPWERARLPLHLCRATKSWRSVTCGCGGALAAAPGEPAWRVVWHGRPTLTEAEALAGTRRDLIDRKGTAGGGSGAIR